jgi:hypothetical protein
MRIDLQVRPRRVLLVLFLLLGVLTALHGVVVVGHLVLERPFGAFTELFDMDREANLPAVFNMALFFLGGLLFYFLGRAETGAMRRSWFLMAAVFVFLGIDEGSQIHEKLMMAMVRLLGGFDQELGIFYYAWTIPYLIVAVVLVAAMGPWLYRIEPQLRWGLILSGTVFVFGAIVLEARSGKVAEPLLKQVPDPAVLEWMPCFAYPEGQCHLYVDQAYVMLYTLEEVLEMSGLILCSGFLLRAVERRGIALHVAFKGRTDGQ